MRRREHRHCLRGRAFWGTLLVSVLMVATGTFGLSGCSQGGASSTLQPYALPYDQKALEPFISQKTFEFHYGKHYQGYVDKTNELLRGSSLAQLPLEEIMKQTATSPDKVALFNNAAQAWNHEFFWKSLKPGGSKPEGELLKKIQASFGSLDSLKRLLLDASLAQFGSGWAWLVLEGDTLKVVKTGNADNPLLHGQVPLLTIDVWEHAYYLDYQNRRGDYVKAIIDNLLNWDFAAANLPKS